MPNTTFETSRPERLSYYSFFTGQNIIYMFVTIFLSIYYTSVLGLSAATVGMILLVARVWDAVNDPMLSILIEKSRLPGGKFKPWIKAITWAVPIATILIFSFGEQIAQLPMWTKVAYASITYILWGMLYTISDAPAYALGTVITKNVEERTTLYSYVRFGGFAGMVIAMVGAPLLLDSLNGQWMFAAMIMGILAMIFMVPIRNVQERHVIEQAVPTLNNIIQAITGNRYLLIFIIAFIFIGGANFAFTLMPFIARDVFQDSGLTSLLLFSIIAPAMLASPLVPIAIRYFGKITTFASASAALVILSIITWGVGYDSLSVFLGLNMLKAIALGVTLVMPSIFIADCIEYGQMKSGQRLEAVTFAAQTFANKAVSAAGGAIAMGYLAWVGFVQSSAGHVVQQPPHVVQGMWDVLNLGHAIGAAIGLVIFLWGYQLTDQRLSDLKEISNTHSDSLNHPASA
ncbi:MFS transporter [Marinomonas posidonica]|uniref:Sugar (Glycoside-Pentoside-Hexuronide) transporter n=1 Tax=Marinomonas posidonica (strain CECT 7376 / NCIMB 14433 / IVIA-Po-181) TaxID=491952 RepID=F6CWF5_MARPP|nr:glycoside-pentoside-hexuronide (GPH):cation symporter [Marinomonas posidonica]AEF53210.1 sugar (Glycoside-Pentoside-Hexuronide) transporter [Marinomonas posidonica IVIA-Po-181]